MALIETEEAAKRLARVILSDIELYNRKKIQAGADLTAELQEGYTLFRSRVAPDLQSLFDEVVADRRFGAARAATRSAPAPAPAPAARPVAETSQTAIDEDAPTPRPYKRHPSIDAEDEAQYLASPATPPPASEPERAAPSETPSSPRDAGTPAADDPALAAARRLARVIVSDIQLYNAKKIAAGADVGGEIAEGRRLFAARVAPELAHVLEDLLAEKGLVRGPKPVPLARAKAPEPTPLLESPVPLQRTAARPEPAGPVEPESAAPEYMAPPEPAAAASDWVATASESTVAAELATSEPESSSTWSADAEAAPASPDEAFPPMEETIASTMNVPREIPAPRSTTPAAIPAATLPIPLVTRKRTPAALPAEALPGAAEPTSSPFDPVPTPASARPLGRSNREPTPAPLSRPITTTPPPSSRPRSVPPPPPPAVLAASRRNPFSMTPTPTPVRAPGNPVSATPPPAARASSASTSAPDWPAPLGASTTESSNLADTFAPAFENSGLSEAIPSPLGDPPESEPTRQEPTYVAPVTVTAVPAASKPGPVTSGKSKGFLAGLSPTARVAIGLTAAASTATLIYFLL